MNKHQNKEIVLVALGGNALIKKGEQGTIEQQFENLKIPMSQIAKLSKDYKIIITHGNGPQVGNLLLQQESYSLPENNFGRPEGGSCMVNTATTDNASKAFSGRLYNKVPKLPLEILVAQTQGQIGYMIESTLDTQLMKLGIKSKPLVSLISYVVVDKKDPAFKNPTKPIGPIYSEKEAGLLEYITRKTSKGYRRVVVSPKPVTIVEKKEIKKLIQMGFIVICCGGGGIPVIREGRSFCGVDAVIDKDLASAKLAQEVGVNTLIIATDVPGVAINYGKPDQKFLFNLTTHQAKKYLEKGYFPEGSMKPKVEAAIQFLQNKGRRAVICSLENIQKAIKGKSGTQFTL